MSADDELLDLLGHSFQAAPAEPSMAELASLQRAVASMPAGRRRRRWGPRTLGLFIGLGALTTTGTAFALEGGHLPQPVVSVARTIGLPVDENRPTPPAPPTPTPTPAVPPAKAARPAIATPPTTAKRAEHPATTAVDAGQAGDGHGHDGSDQGPSPTTTSTTVARSTTTTARVDNSGPGSSSSGSGHGGSGSGSGSGSGDDSGHSGRDGGG